jgi:hypothetical protein
MSYNVAATPVAVSDIGSIAPNDDDPECLVGQSQNAEISVPGFSLANEHWTIGGPATLFCDAYWGPDNDHSYHQWDMDIDYDGLGPIFTGRAPAVRS